MQAEEAIKFNVVRELAVDMLSFRKDAAYHVVNVGVDLGLIDTCDAKEIRECLDSIVEG